MLSLFRPQNRAALLCLAFFLKSLVPMLLPQQMAKDEIKLSRTASEEIQHPAAKIKGPKLPQEIQSAHSNLVGRITEVFPLPVRKTHL